MSDTQIPAVSGGALPLLGLYRGLTTAGLPLIQLLLRRRAARGKEDPSRIDERRGVASLQRPDGPLLWLHAASLGEAQSVLVLIDRMVRERPTLNVLMTTGTVTSAKLMEERLPKRALHQFVPVDRPAWVRRFLDYWRPDLAVWVESELWPNLLLETAARGTPMVLLNARISAGSHTGWKRARGLAQRLLSSFSLVLAQDETIAGRLRDLGAANVTVSGNLKTAAAPLPATAAELLALQDAIGARPVWLAASTHDGEEAIAGAVHAAIAQNRPGLLTIIAPRHPQRAAEIAAHLKREGPPLPVGTDYQQRRYLSGRRHRRTRPVLSYCAPRLHRRFADPPWRSEYAGTGGAQMRHPARPPYREFPGHRRRSRAGRRQPADRQRGRTGARGRSFAGSAR